MIKIKMTHNVPRRRNRPRTFNEKFWHNDQNEFLVWQSPNLFLKIWIACTVVNWFLTINWFQRALAWVGLVSLIVWAGLELFQGANYFRRLLGLLVLLVILASHFV